MTFLAILVVLVLLVMWRRRRRLRAAEYAGRNSERPTYVVDPPPRNHRTYKDGVL